MEIVELLYCLIEEDNMSTYIKLFTAQKTGKQRHKKKTFVEEYKELLKEHNVESDEKYLL
ncbi:hypothetical protein A9P82_04950 [Arachidicoccus ginsenosidimutans]|uniref:hypothetical protein n=1 Tax=Arachidicoccus sp. BS20 TaxID=1850526 RepID=UPI0007F0C8ED|nr:hypothetical protein [Arachidicoccus sp. BS20]ANI88690.1 hypothetical protein A9P82_04950 [Arachidicoccus sp. BS20]